MAGIGAAHRVTREFCGNGAGVKLTEVLADPLFAPDLVRRRSNYSESTAGVTPFMARSTNLARKSVNETMF